MSNGDGKDAESKQDEGSSPFHAFINKTQNMPHLWESIILKLSANDVACSLKVSRGMRSAVGQCLTPESSLRQIMDMKARADAISRGGFHSKTRIDLEGRVLNKICGLDGVLLCQRQCPPRGVNALVINDKSGQTVESRFANMFHGPAFSLVHPSPTPGKIFVQSGFDLKLCEIGPGGLRPVPESHFPCPVRPNQVCFSQEERHCGNEACYIGYRLFFVKLMTPSADRNKMVLSPLSDDGCRTVCNIALYEVRTQGLKSHVRHLPSNEEVGTAM